MEKKVLVLLAEGFEEMEAIITSDLCIRAGLDVCTAGIDGIDVTGAHGLSLIADCELVDIDDEFDAVIVNPFHENAVELPIESILDLFDIEICDDPNCTDPTHNH